MVVEAIMKSGGVGCGAGDGSGSGGSSVVGQWLRQ